MNGSGSRMKGNRFELKVAAVFGDAFNMKVRRVPASGGLDIKCDLYCPEDDTFPYYVECKNRETLRIQSLIDGTSDLFSFYKRNHDMSMKSYLREKYAEVTIKPIVVFKGGDFKTEMVMTDAVPVSNPYPFLRMQLGFLYVYKLADFIEFCDKERLR